MLQQPCVPLTRDDHALDCRCAAIDAHSFPRAELAASRTLFYRLPSAFRRRRANVGRPFPLHIHQQGPSRLDRRRCIYAAWLSHLTVCLSRYRRGVFSGRSHQSHLRHPDIAHKLSGHRITAQDHPHRTRRGIGISEVLHGAGAARRSDQADKRACLPSTLAPATAIERISRAAQFLFNAQFHQCGFPSIHIRCGISADRIAEFPGLLR